MKNFNTLTTRLSIIIISIIVSFSLIIISYNYIKSSQNSYNYLHNLTSNITNAIIEKTRSHLAKTDTHIKLLIHENESDNILDLEEKNIKIMSEYILWEKHLASIYLADNYGNFLQVRRDPKLAVRKIDNINFKLKEFWDYKNENLQSLYKKEYKGNYDARTRFWYLNAKNDEVLTSNPYIFHSTKKLGITIYYSKFLENKKSIVAGIDITLDSLTNFLEKESKQFNCDIALIDDDKRIISSSFKKNHNSKIKQLSDFLEDDPLIKASKKYLEGSTQGNILDKGLGTIHFTGKSFQINQNKTWHIVIVTPEDIILHDAKKILNETILISSIILLLFILIAIFISRKITQPILTLSSNMDELHKLNLDIDAKCDSNIKELRQAQESLAALRHGLKSFSKYMPYKLVQYLISNDKEAQIGGKEKSLAIMFTDIEGFTSISEKLPPKELTCELSIYFTQLAKIIKKNEGTIDKFIGDSIMAFWNAPFDVKDPISKTLITALEIQKELKQLNKSNKELGKPVFKTRIGIHYGRTLVGNIGSQKRMNYTIIGDSVNIAAKLEKKNKKYNTEILISQEVYERVKNDFDMEYIDTVELKGKSKAIKLYTLKGIKKGKS